MSVERTREELATPNVGKHIAWGSAKPADGSAGYAPGCLFMNLGLTNQSDALYCNIGSYASCDFNLVTVAS